MTNFALCYKAIWRNGEVPETKGATHIVTHDTRCLAYDVPADEIDAFREWIAQVFSGDDDPMFGVDFDGSIEEYLDEIDVSICEI